jgi:nucleoside-diphosphate-sugar epimerase
VNTRILNKRIALIGGAGFIGHNLALELARRGAKVDIIDGLQVNNLLAFTSNISDPNRELYLRIINHRLEKLQDAEIPVHVLDARDYHALTLKLSQLKPEVIIQLAAVAHAGRSNKDPYSTFDHSLRTLENALDNARNGCEHFIFLSSSMVYGNFQASEVSEDHQLNPIGIYGALKVAGEKMVIAYQQVFGIPFTIFRPSALYGPGCVSRRVGQVFIENAIHGQKLKIEGDGSESLDFTYIEDLVEGISLSINNPSALNQIFNLTYGNARSMLEMVNIIREFFPEVEVEYAERDRLMPVRGTLSIEKARKLLDYSPKNPLDVGLPKYIRWYEELLGNKAKVAVGNMA